MAPPKDLFIPVAPEANWNPAFKLLKNYAACEPARDCMNEIFSNFRDLDGNFVKDFQTTGFDARVFELYLFSVFYYEGFERQIAYSRPDFVLEGRGYTFSVEAVTANPKPGEPPSFLPLQGDESFEAIVKRFVRKGIGRAQEQLRNEIPLRLSSPLFSKFNKHYWTLPHVAGKPFVLAVEDFHQQASLLNWSEALQNYLYGISVDLQSNSNGFQLRHMKVPDFQSDSKVIPSGFFRVGTEHVSAVLFSNTGTVSKFGRMMLQRDPRRYPKIQMIRVGKAFPTDLYVGASPILFHYWVGDPKWIESWCQGIVVFHNPFALYPLEPQTLPGVMHVQWAGDHFEALYPGFHPYSSMTGTTLLV